MYNNNNYWTRLSKISWFVSGEQINYLPKPKAEQIQWNPVFSNLQAKRKFVREIGGKITVVKQRIYSEV